jgi:enamine deaminase RidA (YjgF/YER057c/UK114 family)
MKAILLALAMSVLAMSVLGCAARTPTPAAPPRVHVLPKGWEGSYHDYHYTPAVRVGDTIIVSGIPAGRGDTYEAKVRWMFQQLAVHLEAAGSSLADVVELTSFHVGATDNAAFKAEFEILSRVHHEFFTEHYPAWTAVGTTALLSGEAPVELRAVAIVGSGATARVQSGETEAR